MKTTAKLTLVLTILTIISFTTTKAQKVTNLKSTTDLGDKLRASFSPTTGRIYVNSTNLKDYKSFKIANLDRNVTSNIIAVEVAYVTIRATEYSFYVSANKPIDRIKLSTPIKPGYYGRVHVPKPSYSSYSDDFEKYFIVAYIYADGSKITFDSNFGED